MSTPPEVTRFDHAAVIEAVRLHIERETRGGVDASVVCGFIGGEPVRVSHLFAAFTAEREALRKDAEREKARADAWREAATEIESFAPIYCEHLSHDRRTFHKSDEPCPVEKRIRAMFDAARAAEERTDG